MSRTHDTVVPPLTRRLVAAIFLLVGLEGVVVLHLWGEGHKPLTHYDYLVYERIALNMLDNQSLSSGEGDYGTVFFRTPGYPLYIAVIYLLFGRSTVLLLASQFALLGIAALLVHRISSRVGDDRVAAVSSFLACTYPPLVIMAASYAAEMLTTVVLLSIILGVMRLQERGSRSAAHYFGLGVAIGALAMIRPSFVLLPLPLFAWYVVASPGAKLLLVRFVAIGLGVSVIVVPWILRNSLLSGRLVGPSSTSGWNLFVSAQQYSGEVSYQLLASEWDHLIVPEYNRRRTEVMRELTSVKGAPATDLIFDAMREANLDSSFARAAAEKRRSVGWIQMIAHLPKRVFWLWSTADVSTWSTPRLHRMFQLHHVLLASSALGGILLLRREVPHLQALLWMAPVYLTLLHFVYGVEARYTVPARVFLIPYCALGMLWAARAVHGLITRSGAAR